MKRVTARAAPVERGLPPKVEPWSPGVNTAACSLAMIAATGTPPPSPLARVMTSGSTPIPW